MTRRADDLNALAEKLQAFLEGAGWMQGRSSNGMRFFHPPQALGIQGKFSVALPDDPARPGVSGLLQGTADTLQELYGYRSVGDMLDRAVILNVDGGPARLTSRFVDLSTRQGSMPLHALGEYLTQLEKSLYNSAKFKLGDGGGKVNAVAQQFTKECLFLQTRQGSFVASVEVPSSTLRQGDLFGNESVESAQVCSSMFSAIDFLNERVLNDDEPLDTDAALADAIALFDVELLDCLSKMLIAPSMQAIDFALEVGRSLRTSSTGTMTGEKVERLKDYVAFIKKHFRGEDDVVVSGSIVELRSRDPAGNRNYILLVAKYHGDRTYISATLDNDQYQRAVDAHRRKLPVTLRGNATRLKTHVRITEVLEFSA
jgi:hypothetical protein